MIYTIADTHLSLTTEKPMDIFGTLGKSRRKAEK